MSCKINHAPEIEGFLQTEYTPGDAIYFCIITDNAIRALGCGSNLDVLEACLQILQTADATPTDLLRYASMRKVHSFSKIASDLNKMANKADVNSQKQAAEQAIRDLLKEDKPKP